MNLAPMTLAALTLLAFCVTAESVQQIGFKVGAERAGKAASLLRGALAQPLIWLGAGLWVAESVAWVQVLERAPISQAYPIMTLTYATVPLAGLLLLKERMTARQALGAALIVGGAVLVGASGA